MADRQPAPGGAARAAGGATGQEIAIVGMSALFPGAGDLDAYWKNIAGGVDAIRDISPDRWDLDEYYRPEAAPTGSKAPGARRPTATSFYCRRGGFVDEFATFDPARFGIMPVAVDWAEPDQLLSLRLAAEAIDDAGGLDRLGDLGRVGVVVGRGGYIGAGMARFEHRVRSSHQLAVTLREVLPDLPASTVERIRAAFLEKLGPERPEATIGLVPNLAASRIANRLDLRGPAYTVDAACASSLIAVDRAVRDLVSGQADAMVVGGVHVVQDVTFWSIFTLLGALSPTQTIRPFDRRADGLLIGEGVGMVVLKRLADARRDGDRVYAVIRGVGSSSDGRTSSLMAPDSAGQRLAIERAWADAGLDPTAPDAVGLIEAHGTATPAGDGTELATLAAVFGAGTGSAPIGLGSVKSMIGHAMPAAGMAGLIKAALALYHRTLPPTLHCDEPHPRFEGTRFVPVRQAAEWERPRSAPRRAGVNAFGFGGINAHVVLEEYTEAGAAAVAPPAPTALVAAAVNGAAPNGSANGSAAGSVNGSANGSGRAAVNGLAGVSARAARPEPEAEPVLLIAGASPAEVAAQLAAPDDELLARDDAAAPPDGPCRLALVAPTPRRLALARTVAARGRPWRGRNDLWFSPEPLLAGHPGPSAGSAGAGAPPRLAFLFCGLEDKFAPRVDDVCDHFGLPRPDLGDTADLGRHAVASVQVGRVLDAALRRMGLQPDVVGGHSVGEWNAMLSAGLLSDQFVDEFINLFDPASLEVPGVVFGALGCGADVAAEVIADLPEVVVSHDNCPHQSIICGREESVATALRRLRERGVLGQTLPFRSGFHSPFLEPYLEKARASLATTPLERAQIPLWSATTVAPYPQDHDEIRELAVRHLLEPVRFRELTERLYESGVRVFVQIGVGSVAGFIDDTLAGREHLALVTNTPKRSGLDQLRRVAAALWAEGAAPRMDLLPCRSRPAVALPRQAPAGAPNSTPAGSSPAAGTVAATGGATATAVMTAPAPAPAATAAQAQPAAGRTARLGRPGQPVRLRLGAPLVRLGPDAAGLLTGGRGAAGPRQPAAAAGTPGAAAATTARTATAGTATAGTATAGTATGGTVKPRTAEPRTAVSGAAKPGTGTAGTGAAGTGAAGQTGPAAPAGQTPPAAAASRPAPSPAGPAQRAAAGTVHRVRRVLSLRELPDIIDHCFYIQPPGWTDLSDVFPVVPLTGILEMIIAEARALMPGRVPVALKEVRALRWLAIEPPVEITVTCQVLGPDEVRVVFGSYTRGTVVFADAYPAPPAATAVTEGLTPRPGVAAGVVLPGEQPGPHTGAELYASRLLFHGPRYQGVDVVEGLSPLGLRGLVRVAPGLGALLDVAGQLFGYWGTQYLPTNWLMLPASVEAIRFYGPPPPVGARLSYLARVRDVTDRTATCDMELRTDSGRLWAHVESWTDRRFSEDEVLWPMSLAPQRNVLSSQTADGWVVARARWGDPASRELSLRHYLDAAGREELGRHNPRAALGWLMGRIAAKDAVRLWWWARGAGDLWGIEIGVGNLPSGQPVVTSLPSRPDLPPVDPPSLSIAHKKDLAVALVDARPGVGIDLEAVERREPGVEAAALTADEVRLLDELAGTDPDLRALWFTRIWAAKEAAAKAEGTGLAGRPRQFVVGRPRPGGAPGAPAAGSNGGAALPPPMLVPVSVPATAGSGAAQAGEEGRRVRWVALRIIDSAGRQVADPPAGRALPAAQAGPGRAAGSRSGHYVVAWTSAQVEVMATAGG